MSDWQIVQRPDGYGTSRAGKDPHPKNIILDPCLELDPGLDLDLTILNFWRRKSATSASNTWLLKNGKIGHL